MNSEQFDINQIDDETEFVLDKFREGYKAIEIKNIIKNYLEARIQQSYTLTLKREYKCVYFIQKKAEKVLLTSLKNLSSINEQMMNYKEVMLYLLDNNQTISQNEKKTILKLPIDIQVSPKGDEAELYYYLMKQQIQILNNIGVILMMRNKLKESQSYFIRALAARSYVLENQVSQYQIGMVMQNFAFTLNNADQKEDAKQFMNKSILTLEILAEPEYENLDASIGYNQFLCLIQILYNRRDPPLLQEPREISKEKMIYLLALSYHYYSEIFESLEQATQSKFCQNQFSYLSELYHKLNPRSQMIRNQYKRELASPQEVEIAKHTLSKSTFKDENFSQISVQSKKIEKQKYDEISKEKIIFQKYVMIKQKRFKVIVFQLEEYFQILLYSKPLDFMRKIIIMYDDLIEYQKQNHPTAFDDEQKLKEFFKQIIKKLYLVGDDLRIKDLQHFGSVEEAQGKGGS